ncbi:hypothetical protein RB195_018640 [Necator americanus]|uniref:Integrase zinc-binding domain-containing protein n=1 Tax=Necator americanus TaxID=51031 RepID=A0ABR1CAP3_NECAM
MLMSLRNSQKTVVIFQYPPNSFGLLRKAIVLQSYSPVLCECQKLAQSQPPFLSVPLPQPQKYRDDSQRMSANCIPHSQTKMKMLAKSFVYWPTMNPNIEKLPRTCPRCVSVAKDPVKAELRSSPKSHSPWTRVHADFAGPMEERHY